MHLGVEADILCRLVIQRPRTCRSAITTATKNLSLYYILTFKSVTPERIIATDSHNDIIYFLRDHLVKTLLPVNLVDMWKFSIYAVIGTGPSTSGKFVFERGTSEFPSSIGEFPTSNANFTEIPFYQKSANGDVYTFTLNDIKRGNWDMDNHILSLYQRRLSRLVCWGDE
jgi:hypothetical protein